MNVEFKNWYLENSNKNGGLISKKTAGDILNKSLSGISSAIKRDNLHVIKYKNSKTEFLSFNEVMEYENKKYIRK